MPPTAAAATDTRPVDSGSAAGQLPGVSKKPHKVEETQAAYPAKAPRPPAPAADTPPALPQDGNPGPVRYLDSKTARKLTAKIFAEHDDLFRKLAQ